ncbi:MAG: hypothetical protein AB1705_26060 [Verrucomicrobiota bacterium]
MKTETVATLKRREARQRMAALRQARVSKRAATRLQRRASLVNGGSKWRITNLRQVLQAMGRCAKPK